MPRLLRGAMWVAIGALIAGAIVCVVWVLMSPEGDVIPKAFLTILLLAAFAGAALLDSHLAYARPPWLVVASMTSWVLALVCGLTLIWTPASVWSGPIKVWNFILIIGFLQLALLHQRLLWKVHARYVTTFTRSLVLATTVFVLALLVMALVPLTLFELIELPDIYGRIMVSLAILGAVGTALVPLVGALFAPRRPAAPRAPHAPGQVQGGGLLPWPTYGDGVTPLPMRPDGQPDFDAQRTGVPSPGSRSFAPVPRPAPAIAGSAVPQPGPRPFAPGAMVSQPAPGTPYDGASQSAQGSPEPQGGLGAPGVPSAAASQSAQGSPEPQGAPDTPDVPPRPTDPVSQAAPTKPPIPPVPPMPQAPSREDPPL
ncbi:hypothetical protein [Microbacterium suaedae]|uniref:hypothetical protein n=1 Tax=Microbacterium suaedae TaxID=2067813 RepID=UPI0013A647BA|nr:hypothetical protein [Microbacterium suaedae]